MTMTTATRSYIGKGKIYAGLRSGGAMRPIGNVSKISLAISEEKKELKDFTSAGGGTKDTWVVDDTPPSQPQRQGG